MFRIMEAKKILLRRQAQRKIEMERELEMALLDGKIDAIHKDWMNDLLAVRAQTGVRGMIARA